MDRLKPVIFTTRFSILRTVGDPLWRAQKRGGVEYYRRSLFDPDRLAVHLRLFETLTLPSIDAQIRDQNDPIALHVMISTELPEPTRSALTKLVNAYPWASLVEVAPDEPTPHEECIHRSLKLFEASKTTYAHCRLDDDDALSKDFVARLRQYMKDKIIGYYVSFGRGYTAIYNPDNNSFQAMFSQYYPKIGLGLARIGHYNCASASFKFVNAYNPEQHTRSDRFAPTILDSTAPAWVRTVHIHQDSKQNALRALSAAADPHEVERHFALSISMLPTLEQSKKYLSSLPIEAGWVEDAEGIDPGYGRLLQKLRKVDSEKNRLQENLCKKQKQVAVLEGELNDLKNSNCNLRNELIYIRSSFPWKIYKIIRRLGAVLSPKER